MSDVGGPGAETLFLGRVDRPGRDGLSGTSGGAKPAAADEPDLVTFGLDSHLLTIAPNLSGRTQSCLVPNLLTYRGQVVVVDLDGEAYNATAEARRQLGHTVVRLDPFCVTGPEPDSLDPIDLTKELEEPALTSACQDIAGLLPLRGTSGDAVEYDAFGLLSGLIGYLAAIPEKRAFGEIYPTLHSDDVVYSLAVVLDTAGKAIPAMSYSEISAFLQREDATRSRILARLIAQFAPLGNPAVQNSLRQSSVPLPAMTSGAPVSVYIIIPAEQLSLHSVLLRIWIGALLHSAARMRGRPGLPTLFLLDHCAELGPLPLLESLLSRGTGESFCIWTFWHDIHQLRSTYPSGWPAIVAGSGAIQAFGTRDSAAAAEAGAVLGLPANDVWALGVTEQIVRLDGAPQRIRRLDGRSMSTTG